MAKDVTLADVARLSGVSRATASRALNNRPGVKPAVRERVLSVASESGYRPNRAAQNLAGNGTSVIGLLLGHAYLEQLPYAGLLVQEVTRAADAHGLGVLLITDMDNPSRGVRNLVNDGLVNGVVVSVTATDNLWTDELLEANMPAVQVGQGRLATPVKTVDVENKESSAHIVGHLLDTGCIKLGTITGPLDRLDARLRHEGFLLAHERRSIPVDESLILEGNNSKERAYELAAELLDRQPDGVFAGNDQTALAVCRQARERGINIPEQLSVAGFDGTYIDEFSIPRITSVVQPFTELGTKLVEGLIAAMNGDNEAGHQLLTPSFFYGETTRPPVN